MLSLRVVSLLLLLACAPGAAKAPISHQSMWLMKRVGAPVVSPDGRRVVFSVVEPAYDEKDQITDLWIAAVDGTGEPRRLTATKGPENGIAWSPDGSRIAFTARREGDEANQVYVLPLDGGEAVRITSLSTGASNPRWSPDGQQLLFTSTVYPGAVDDEANQKIAAERRARKYRARVYESFPIRYWDRWLDDMQVHLLVQKAEPGAKARDLLAGTGLVQEPGFAGVSTATGQDLQAVWTPDGQGVVFAATVNRNQAAFAPVVTHLYQVCLCGGDPVALTRGADSYSNPKFRPDGKALYALHHREGEKVYSLDRLAMLDWPSPKEPRLLTDALDRSVGAFDISPDSRRLYLLAEESGHEKLFSLPAAGGPIEKMEMHAGVYTNLDVAGDSGRTVIVANWESAVSPAEVVRIDPAARSHRAITRFNEAAAGAIDWLPLRHFTFSSKRGRQIHNLLALPPGFDESKKYPLIVLIHGGPHSMWRDQFFLRWNYHLIASPGYVILLTNYTGSTGFGEKFAQDIQGDPLRGPGEELNEAADEAIRRFPFIDGSRQAAGGASYGGHLANWLQATTTRYKALVSHAGLINLESQWGTSDTIYHRELNHGGPVWEQGPVWREQNPIRLAKNFRTPILLTIGENDFRVPLNQTLENWSVLQRQRVPSRLIVFPDANHWIQKAEDSRFFYQELLNWFRKYLG